MRGDSFPFFIWSSRACSVVTKNKNEIETKKNSGNNSRTCSMTNCRSSDDEKNKFKK